MSRKRADRPLEPDRGPSDVLPVMFAANKAEAELYQMLLADAGIQAVIDVEAEEQAGQPGKGIAVLVPAEQLDEASDIITSREEIEEHILADPEAPVQDEDEEELTAPSLNDEPIEDEDLFFRPDPLADDEDND